MKLTQKVILSLLAVLSFAGCDSSIYKGFTKMDNGAYMKFYVKNDEGAMPEVNDLVTFDMLQFFEDTLIFSTEDEEPIRLAVEEPSFVGDIFAALTMMHVGDSAEMVFLADSMFVKSMEMETPEQMVGKPLYYVIKLLEVKPFAEVDAEYHEWLESQRQAEEEALTPFINDKNNVVLPSGLISCGKLPVGKTAKNGEYVIVDFIMCSLDGDTLMESFSSDESIEVQLGNEAFFKGMDEIMFLLPKGTRKTFIVPSSLAFDSTGYEDIILPYMPLCLDVKMNDIMSEDAYKAFQTKKAEDQKKLREQRKKEENVLIQAYLKSHAIQAEADENGMYVVREQEGEGPLAKWGDAVLIKYELSNLNGDIIESSEDYGKPMQFNLGKDEMIFSIEEALQTMNKGGKVLIVTPSEYGFGDAVIDENLLPANSPLVIRLELVDVF